MNEIVCIETGWLEWNGLWSSRLAVVKMRTILAYELAIMVTFLSSRYKRFWVASYKAVLANHTAKVEFGWFIYKLSN